MSGWIKLYRGWRDSPVFADERMTEREAWLWLIEHAAWRDMHRRGGKGEVVFVKRGQIHSAERTLAAKFGWDRKRIGRFLGRLEQAQMITQQRDHSGITITVCNYDAFQEDGSIQGANRAPDHGTVAGPSRGHLGATQEEEKESKEEEETPLANAKGARARERAAPPPKPARASGTRIPDDWKPPPLPQGSHAAKVATRRGDEWLAEVAEGFANRWRGKAGADARMVDWDATWRNWIVREDRYENERQQRRGGHGPRDDQPRFRDPLLQRVAEGRDPLLDERGVAR